MNLRIKKIIRLNIVLQLSLICYYFINKYTGLYIPCIFKIITGFKCPGCGITHLLFHIIKLDLKDAFYDNPLVFIYLPFIIVYYIYQNYLYIYNKKDYIVKKIPNFIWIILIVITILYGIIRNIIKI